MRFKVKSSCGTTDAIATAVIDLKSRPASAKRLRACTPYSSIVRARSVVRRQCQARYSSSNTPSDVFVFPTSITSNIRLSSSQVKQYRERRRVDKFYHRDTET